MYIQNLVKILSICSKILSGYEILTKGHNSVTNLWKMMCNNPNLDLVDMNAYLKFDEFLSICFQAI